MSENEIIEMRNWCKAAYHMINQAVGLLDYDALMQLEGVRALQEMCPLPEDELFSNTKVENLFGVRSNPPSHVELTGEK